MSQRVVVPTYLIEYYLTMDWCGLESLPGNHSMNHMTHSDCSHLFVSNLPWLQ